MMIGLLLYAYCTGVYSSRRIERATYEDIAFRVVTGNQQPYFTTVNEFRREHRERFVELFVEALKLCRRAGPVEAGARGDRRYEVEGEREQAQGDEL